MRISDWSSDVCSSDLLQLGASQGLTENELYQEALAFNTFWYPQIYVQTALYFKVVEGIDWADVDHRIVMGSRYSAPEPWRTSVGARVARIPKLLPQASDANCGAHTPECPLAGGPAPSGRRPACMRSVVGGRPQPSS